MPARRWLCLPLTAALLAGAGYVEEIGVWRARREASLQTDQGWLTVAGLFWLKPGVNRFGSTESNEIVLPASAPASAGVFNFTAGTVTVTMSGGSRELKPDSADAVEMGPLTVTVIKRGERVGIRLRDRNSAIRRGFHGLRWFPVKPDYRVTARWVAEPRQIPIANIIGITQPMPSPGYAVFQVSGREARLYPVLEEPDAKELFFIFRDQTSGHETYGAGRFLYTGMPRDGKLVIDFNKAYNPPCAFTPYATCPLPPKDNRLAVRIAAGELDYGAH